MHACQSYCFAFVGIALAITAQLLLNKHTFRSPQHGKRRRSSSPIANAPVEDEPEAAREPPQPPWATELDEPMLPEPPQPPPRPAPSRPPASIIPSLQPDEVRVKHQTSAGELTAMRCGERIPPESILTTEEGSNAVTVFARAFYKGPVEDGMHAWGYRIEFTNRGPTSVQLLTRHWVIADSNGRAEEIKGPGARGMLPILKSGEKWDYESGTRIATDRGSIHGWFTFEEQGDGELFAARVGRLALSPDGHSTDVPCMPPADASSGSLPSTSVHATERVIVGAITEVAHRDDDLRTFAFMVDLQVNNARAEPITILGVRWEIIDANGQRHISAGTVGEQSGNGEKLGAIRLAPGSALRLKTTLPQLHTPRAKISGVLIARFGSAADDDPGGFIGELDLTYDDDFEDNKEIVIAPLGASIDGEAVKAFEPLGFLP